MRTSLWALSFLVTAVACGSSSSYSGTPQNESQHPESPPEDGPSGTSNDLDTKTGELGGAGGAPASMGGSGGTTTEPPGGAADNPAQYLSALCGGWFAQPNEPIRAVVADSNGTVSAARAAELLGLELAPAPKEIRLDHFFNYYDTPPQGQVNAAGIGVTLALRKRLIPGLYDLFVGVRAPLLPRPRSVLTVVVDTTPSMDGVPLVRAGFVLEALATALQPGDKVVLLTTDPKQGEKTFDSFGASSPLALEGAKLAASQEADVTASLELAYAKANAELDPKALNRVVFVTDGAEPTSSLPTATIVAGAEKGLFLVGIGAGPTTSYRERLLDQATFDGRGSYTYVSTWESAQREIVSRYDRLMGIAYDDVRLELKLPWYLHRADEEPANGTDGYYRKQYLAPGASLTFLFRLQACHKDAFLKEPTPIVANVSYVEPGTNVEQSTSGQWTILPLDKLAADPGLDKALAIQGYAQALQSLDAKRVQRAQELAGAESLAGDPDVASIAANLVELGKLLAQ